MRRTVWCFLITLLSCGVEEPQPDVVDQPSEADSIVVIEEEELMSEMDSTSQFLNYYRKFIATLVERSNEELDQYFHPEHGLHIIHSFSGAMPQISQFRKSNDFNQDQDIKKAIESLQEEVTLEPQFEVLPVVVCDDDMYDKTGCFAAYTNNNLEQHPWNAEQKYTHLIETVSITVVNTYLTTFYFSLIDGEWYVTFIDLRTPCQA